MPPDSCDNLTLFVLIYLLCSRCSSLLLLLLWLTAMLAISALLLLLCCLFCVADHVCFLAFLFSILFILVNYAQKKRTQNIKKTESIMAVYVYGHNNHNSSIVASSDHGQAASHKRNFLMQFS